MFDNEQNPRGLNNCMSVIVDKQGILSHYCEETKNT